MERILSATQSGRTGSTPRLPVATCEIRFGTTHSSFQVRGTDLLLTKTRLVRNVSQFSCPGNSSFSSFAVLQDSWTSGFSPNLSDFFIPISAYVLSTFSVIHQAIQRAGVISADAAKSQLDRAAFATMHGPILFNSYGEGSGTTAILQRHPTGSFNYIVGPSTPMDCEENHTTQNASQKTFNWLLRF